MRKILVMNGPNLDMLGTREPEIYGHDTLETLEDEVVQYGARRGVVVECFQSNSEGELIGKIHDAAGEYDGVVYNPGAHTHYSYALRDAVASIDTPFVEVHLSDIDDREPFRQISVIAPACIAQIKGLGVKGYCRAVDILCDGKQRVRLGDVFEQLINHESIVIAPEPAHAVTRGSAAVSVSEPEPVPASAYEFGEASDQAPAPQVALQPDFAFDAPVKAQLNVPASAPVEFQPASSSLPEETPVDYTSAFAGAVAAVDAGLLSYERQALVHRACERLGIGSLLVRDTSNIHWITALDGVFDEERAHGLLVAGGRAFLHTDSRYANAVRSTASRIGSDIVVNEERISHPQFAFNVLTQNGTTPMAGKLGIEDTITYAEFVKMVERFKTDALAPTTEVVLRLRAVKDAGEITRLKAAQAVTDAAFTHIIGFMRPGMTERDVQLELEDFMVRHGAEGLSFRSIVAAGENGADPHAVPGNTRLEAGQCVVMDFGAKAYGYCSDMTRTVFLGRPQGAMADAWETLRRANETVEAMLKPGVTGAEVHELAERVLEEGGFGGCMGHGLGHGVGLDVHELPTLNPRNKMPLAAGNVVTVEPGIYLPGKFGMRLEDFGVITDTGYEVFTQSTHEMVII